jgi:hypothetical protein
LHFRESQRDIWLTLVPGTQEQNDIDQAQSLMVMCQGVSVKISARATASEAYA